MSVRIRLRRMGKKKHPSYRLAIVDSRVKRDGRFIEFVGFYDPMTRPHTVTLKEDRILQWLGDGASFSDTVGSILRQSGLLERWHAQHAGKAPEAETKVEAPAKVKAARKAKLAVEAEKTAEAGAEPAGLA